MLQFITRLLTAVCLAISLPASAQDLSFNVSVDAYSDPVSIREFTDDWQGSFEGGDHAFAQGRAEFVLHQPKQELAAFWRYDYLLGFTEDTARLVYDYKNKNTPLAGSFPLLLKAHYSEAYGVRWQPLFQPHPTLTLGVGLSLLKGYKLTEGRVSGQLNLNGQGMDRYGVDNANLNLSYHYDEPQLHEEDMDWYPENPSGEGFSIDVSGLWQYRRTTVKLQVYDLIGRLYWHDAPITEFQARYQAVPLDHELTGQLDIDQSYTQRLPAHGFVELSQQWRESWSSAIHLLANREAYLATISTGYHWQHWHAAVLAEPQTGALGLELRHPNLYLRWLADDLNTNQAHRLGLSLGVSKSW